MIYNGDEGDIIYQYISFCKVFNEQIEKHKDLVTGEIDEDAAIKETFRICRDKRLLAKFLGEHENEVYNIMSDYVNNAELLMRIHRNSERRIGAHDAKLGTARNLLNMNLTLGQIAQATELPLSEVTALQAEITQTAE